MSQWNAHSFYVLYTYTHLSLYGTILHNVTPACGVLILRLLWVGKSLPHSQAV